MFHILLLHFSLQLTLRDAELV